MRSFSIIAIAFILIVQTCTVSQPISTSAEKKEAIQPVNAIDFEKEVLPIMAKNCSPCHFTGGKMYERMPFDKDTTIIHHGTAILKRIKKEEENHILQAFLAQKKK